MTKTPLEQERSKYQPVLPKLFHDLSTLHIEKSAFIGSKSLLQEHFPNTWQQPLVEFVRRTEKVPLRSMRIGVLFSGGQAPGGHNVIVALFDAMMQWHKESVLIGFLGGPKALISNKTIIITADLVERYRNLGGFEMIGSGRTKIEKREHFERARESCTFHRLDGLVIIGGDDSNTDAASLAENFLEHGVTTKVIGVPKTIDGDLRNEYIEASFGFDTATKIYSEMIGNLAKDALSFKKYTHFIKLMGRSASHVTLECALQTQPNLALIGEEVALEQWTLKEIVDKIATLVEERSAVGKEYGVILVPEGLIEFIPECKLLIAQLNQKIAQGGEDIIASLSEVNRKLFSFLPKEIGQQLLSDRDAHGNVQLSHISTEKLLIELTKKELQLRGFKGSFHPLHHFFGYEGRAGMPSNFDATYCYALGFAAFALIRAGCTGYVASVQNLAAPSSDWKVGGVPLVAMMHLEERHGKMKCVIAKKLVDLTEKPFVVFAERRELWRLEDHYLAPGPLQFFGATADLRAYLLILL